MDQGRDELLAELFGTGSVPAGLSGRLLRTREVAKLFQVSERTISEWARRGRIPCITTPGGHRLYPASHVRDVLLALQRGEDEGASPASQPAASPPAEEA